MTNIDGRECGWLGCGHPSCVDKCHGVDLADWLWWRHIEGGKDE